MFTSVSPTFIPCSPTPPAAYIQNKANFPFHQPCLFMGFWTGSTLTSTSGYNSSNSSKHICWNQPRVDALLPLVAIGVTAFSESWRLRGSYTDKEQTCEIAPHCTDTKIYVNLLSFHEFYLESYILWTCPCPLVILTVAKFFRFTLLISNQFPLIWRIDQW